MPHGFIWPGHAFSKPPCFPLSLESGFLHKTEKSRVPRHTGWCGGARGCRRRCPWQEQMRCARSGPVAAAGRHGHCAGRDVAGAAGGPAPFDDAQGAGVAGGHTSSKRNSDADSSRAEMVRSAWGSVAR